MEKFYLVRCIHFLSSRREAMNSLFKVCLLFEILIEVSVLFEVRCSEVCVDDPCQQTKIVCMNYDLIFMFCSCCNQTKRHLIKFVVKKQVPPESYIQILFRAHRSHSTQQTKSQPER